MKIINLLEKNQQVQFTIFEFFISQQTLLSLKELEKEIQVSLPTLQKELGALQLELHAYHEAAKIQKDAGDGYRLFLPNDFSKKGFLNHYLQQSLNYQLLLAIIQSKSTSITQLMIDFQISEASLFRRFKALNQLLEEFDLQIKNKKLIGEEKQIRYFYFHLLWQGNQPSQLSKKLNLTVSKNLVNVLENELQRVFSIEEKLKLLLWFYLMELRFNYQGTKKTSLPMNSQCAIEEDPIFQILKGVLARYLSRFAYQNFESETLYLYLFCLAEGFFLIDEETPCYLEKISLTNNEIKKILFEEVTVPIQATIFLSPIHCQIAFFKGCFEDNYLSCHCPLSNHHAEKLRACMNVIEKELSEQVSHNQWKMLDYVYGYLIYFFERSQIQTVEIGIAYANPSLAQNLLFFLQDKLQLLQGIHLEIANAEKQYQILICDEYIDTQPFHAEEQLLPIAGHSSFDIERVIELIHHFKRNH